MRLDFIATVHMFLSQAAYHVLVSPDNTPMGNLRPADFPSALAFNLSECKTMLHYLSEFLSIVIVLPEEGVREGAMHVSFKKHIFSNFVKVDGYDATINGTPIRKFHCGEQFFKAACVVKHMEADPEDARHIFVDNRLEALHAVMNAATPKAAKAATSKLAPFYSSEWDAVSFEAMTETQIWKAMDQACHDFHLYLAELCSEHAIHYDHVYFYEAIGKFDLVWGTGLEVDAMHARILELPGASWGTPDCTVVPAWARPFPGENKLGRAIQTAFRYVVGGYGEFVGETVAEFTGRVGTEFSSFQLEQHKRARTGSA